MNTTRFFAHYYNNAQINSILIMDQQGNVLGVNKSFTNHFGFRNEDIQGKNFSLLFTESDQEKGKPQIELATVAAKGQANDENYVINKDGEAIWCMGESMLVEGNEGESYIVKDIVNLQAKKQVQLFLIDTEELLERIFYSSKEVPMMILDGSLKIQMVNAAFLRLFEMNEAPAQGGRIADLPHPFWSEEKLQSDLRQVLVKNVPLKGREFVFRTQAGETKSLLLSSKIINRRSGIGRNLFLLIDEA